MTQTYLPEGRLLHTPSNQAACATRESLARAMADRAVLEGEALLCDERHDLLVRLGPFTGRIPREEAALGIAEGSTRDIAILARVGKPVAFTVEALEELDGVLFPLLSRRRAQELALDRILETWFPGQVVPATVTHLEPFGAFVDVGCGVPSMIGVERLSVSRIPHARDRLSVGQEIYAAVLSLDRDRRRVVLTHKELLGTWSENAALFRPGMTVTGIVRSLQPYGIFVELTPNLSGLAEVREGFREGEAASVYIKSIDPSKMKLKLHLIDPLGRQSGPTAFRYFITDGVLDRWDYAPEACPRPGTETVFEQEKRAAP